MEIPKDLKGKVGVYRIVNTTNGKVYVGSSSRCLDERLKLHIWNLNRGDHTNKHLQYSWNKYGSIYFVAEILQIVDSNDDMLDILDIEEDYIKQFWGDNCYNMVRSTDPTRILRELSKSPKTNQSRRDKMVAFRGGMYDGTELISPEGKDVIFLGSVRNFAKKNNLHHSSFTRLLQGTRNECQGWRRIDSLTKKEIIEKKRWGRVVKSKYYQQKLINPDGKVVKIEDSVTRFAEKYGLHQSEVSLLLVGKRNQTKGWRLATEEDLKEGI